MIQLVDGTVGEEEIAPRIQGRLALACSILLALFTALTVWVVVASDLSLLGA